LPRRLRIFDKIRLHTAKRFKTMRCMLARVCSAAVNGIEAYPVEVEVNAGYGATLLLSLGYPMRL
jgi:hypothetical protein